MPSDDGLDQDVEDSGDLRKSEGGTPLSGPEFKRALQLSWAFAAATAMLLCLFLAFQPKSTEAPLTEDATLLTIFYWPHLARAAALFRMCDASGQAYQHLSSIADMASVTSSNKVHGPAGTSGMFAPPVIRHGEYTVSQSVAGTLYLGQTLGFDPCKGEHASCLATTIQHMNDLQDFTVEYSDAVSSLRNDRDPTPMRAFIEDGRFTAWLTTFNNSIQGPYYYGGQKSYVDFYLLQTLDWCMAQAFDALQPITGAIFTPFSKVTAAHAEMRMMPSYGSTNATGSVVGYFFGEADVALYEAAPVTSAATLGTYPGRADVGVSGQVLVTATLDLLRITGDLSGLPHTTAGFHIHSGVSCDKADAVGGHWWGASTGIEDPWTTVYTSDRHGNATLAIEMTAEQLGVDPRESLSHTVVVHDGTGDRIACGVLRKTR